MLDKILLRDTQGNKSVTVTAFVLGFVVVNLKLLASGLTLAGYEMSAFTGVDYAAAIGALGTVYVLRRSTVPKQEEKSDE